MIYPYVRHQVNSTPAISSGEIARPEIPIRVVGPNGALEITALLDTGADHVFLPVLLADLLGIDDLGEPDLGTESAGGYHLTTWPGEVTIEIHGDGRTYRWNTYVGFIDSDNDFAAAYLGHAGFLEYFRAVFDYAERTIELIPKPGIIQAG